MTAPDLLVVASTLVVPTVALAASLLLVYLVVRKAVRDELKASDAAERPRTDGEA